MRNLNLSKRIFIIFLILFTNSLVSNASILFTGFKVFPQYLDANSSLKVANSAVKTPFKFKVALGRYLTANGGGAYDDGSCTITLMMARQDTAGDVEVSVPKSITSADWGVTRERPKGEGYLYLALDGELPVGTMGWSVFLRVTYYNTNLQKTVTEDMRNKYVPISYAHLIPVKENITDLFDSPSASKYEIGFKLPDEDLELKWNSSKLPSGTVNVTIYEVEFSYPDSYIDKGAVVAKKLQVPNTGSFRLDAAAIKELKMKLTFDYHYKYYAIIEDVAGNKYGRSGFFC